MKKEIVQLVQKRCLKLHPEQEIFTTTYYEFPGNFTSNLKGSKKFLQISVGVSTQYDEQVMANVESHQLASKIGNSNNNVRIYL